MSDEVRLPEGQSGTEVWRSGDQVLRTGGPWIPTVHAFLEHLAGAGFDGAPRALGTTPDGREVLSFVAGDVLSPRSRWRPGQPTPWPAFARSDRCLRDTAVLLRRFHDAAASFVPSPTAVWRRYNCSSELGPDEIVCHGDVGPHNTVYRDGRPVAFIDWDSIHPSDPRVEFGNAVWRFVPLGDERYFQMSDFASEPELPSRLALFAQAYGLTDPQEVIWSLQQAKQRTVDTARFWPASPAQVAAVFHQVADDLMWLDTNADALVRPLR